MRSYAFRLFLILIVLMAVSAARSTITDYNFSSAMGTYTEISGGTVHGTTANDNEVYNGIPLGFSFNYNGTVYEQISIAVNGYIAMGSTVVNNTSAISSGVSNNVLAVCNRDIMSRSNGELMSSMTGTAPNRVFTIQWKNYRRYPASCANDYLSFQIKLYETSNTIKFAYGFFYAVNYATAQTVQVGLRGSANTEYVNRTTTTNWNATTAGTSNTATCRMNDVIVPSTGLEYTWAPPIYPAQVLAPIDNGVNIGVSTALTWLNGGIGIPIGYRIYLGTNIPPSNIINGMTLTTTSYDPNPDLSYNTVYYWRIVPFNANGDASNCPIWSFTTAPEPPSQANVVSPSNSATDVLLNASLNWSNGGGVLSGYRVYLGTNNPPTNIVNGTTITTTSYDPNPDLNYNTLYYWKIVPFNVNGDAQNCPVWSFTTWNDPPNPISNFNPENYAVDIGIKSSLNWESGGGLPSGYRVFLGTDNPPTNMANGTSVTTTNYDPVMDFLYNTQYYWKIVPFNNNGDTQDCPTWAFTTWNDPPLPVSLSYPGDFSTGNSRNASLGWTGGENTADGYSLRFGTDNPPTNILNNIDMGNATSYTPINTLEYNTTYYWQVIPYNAIGNAFNCPVWSFTTIDGSSNWYVYAHRGWQGIGFPYDQQPWVYVLVNNIIVVNGLTVETDQGDNSASFAVVPGDQVTVSYIGGLYSYGDFFDQFGYNFVYSVYGTNVLPGWSISVIVTGDPPNPAVMPTPQNNAVNIPSPSTLSWNWDQTGDPQYGYTLKFGTDNPPTNTIYNTQWGSSTIYYFSEPPALNTTFYWQVIPFNSYNNPALYPVWSFTTWNTPPPPAVLNYPGDTSVNNLRNVLLQWTTDFQFASGNRLSIGTDNPPTNILNNSDMGSSSSYSLGTEYNFNTTYYWQVIPYNPIGSAVGCPIWSFSTLGTPPPPASLNQPGNTSINILPNTVLRWTTDFQSATGNRLRLGTDNPPTNIVSNADFGSVNSYALGNAYAFNTTYYWQVIPYNPIGSTVDAPIWSFTTINPAIQHPNGGEQWRSGTTETISWSGNAPGNALLYITYDNGTQWTNIGTTPWDNHYFHYQVPALNSSLCKIKIVSSSNSNVYDFSNSNFTITSSSTVSKVVLSYPSASSIYLAVGSSINVTWTRQNVSSVALDFSVDNGQNWTEIVSGLTTNSYSWQVPDNPVLNCRIRARSTLSQAVQDISDNAFSISKINLLSPNGGEILTGDHSSYNTYNITWSSAGMSNVMIEYSSNGGTSWTTVINSASASGSYLWTVPSAPTTNGKIRISNVSNTAINDVSDAVFTIRNPLKILNANGGGFITNNSLFNIRWLMQSINTSTPIYWEYSTNNTSWTRINSVAVPVSNQSMMWFVNTGLTTTMWLRAVDSTTNRIAGKSESSFRITDNFITISEPNGGENYQVLSTQIISWDYSGLTNIRLSYTLDDGLTWVQIVGSVPASSLSYPWTLPNTPSTTCRIKIQDLNSSYMVLESDTNFSILPTQIIPPLVDFYAVPISGEMPLAVQFTETVSPGVGTITSRLWNFGDNATSSITNPQHTYTVPGIYSVSLTVVNSYGADSTFTRVDYIEVLPNHPLITLLSEQSLDFGTIYLGDVSMPLTVFVKNTGTDVLSINEISFYDVTSRFSIQTVPLPTTLAVGDSVALQVFFTPVNSGVVNDTLYIQSNAANSPTLKLHIMGSGQYVPPSPPSNVNIVMNGYHAVLTWDAVTETIYHTPIVPDFYFIYYNGSVNVDGQYYFHGLSTSTSYTHPYVGMAAENMFYRVVAIKLNRESTRSAAQSGFGLFSSDIESYLKHHLKQGMSIAEVENVLKGL